MEKELTINEVVREENIGEEFECDGIIYVLKRQNETLKLQNVKSKNDITFEFYVGTILNMRFKKIQEPEVRWDEIPRGTKVQIKRYFDSEWQNKYFIRRVNGIFYVSDILDDNFIGKKMEDKGEGYIHCRLYKED